MRGEIFLVFLLSQKMESETKKSIYRNIKIDSSGPDSSANL